MDTDSIQTGSALPDSQGALLPNVINDSESSQKAGQDNMHNAVAQQQRGKPVCRREWVATIAFWAIFLSLLFVAQTVLIDKGTPNEIGWLIADRTTEYNLATPIDGFYSAPKDSLDVVFLGSSIVFCGLNPNVIFEKYGYSSYAFGTGLMGMHTTICFLEEALRTQHPKAIVLDATMLAPIFSENVNGGYEASIWYMPFSAAKVEFTRKLDTFDETASVILPIYRFHSRWKSVVKSDFCYFFSDKNDYLLGLRGRESVSMDDAFDIYYSNTPDDMRQDAPLDPKVIDFLTEAKMLCEQYGAELVLVTFPSMDARLPVIYPFFNTLSDYLVSQEIPYINYLTQDERLRLGKEDIADARHLTTSGATKFSLVIGEDLQSLLALQNNWDNPDYAYYRDCYEKYVALVKTIPDWEALNAF